jgi:hypothetical protein
LRRLLRLLHALQRHPVRLADGPVFGAMDVAAAKPGQQRPHALRAVRGVALIGTDLAAASAHVACGLHALDRAVLRHVAAGDHADQTAPAGARFFRKVVISEVHLSDRARIDDQGEGRV